MISMQLLDTHRFCVSQFILFLFICSLSDSNKQDRIKQPLCESKMCDFFDAFLVYIFTICEIHSFFRHFFSHNGTRRISSIFFLYLCWHLCWLHTWEQSYKSALKVLHELNLAASVGHEWKQQSASEIWPKWLTKSVTFCTSSLNILIPSKTASPCTSHPNTPPLAVDTAESVRAQSRSGFFWVMKNGTGDRNGKSQIGSGKQEIFRETSSREVEDCTQYRKRFILAWIFLNLNIFQPLHNIQISPFGMYIGHLGLSRDVSVKGWCSGNFSFWWIKKKNVTRFFCDRQKDRLLLLRLNFWQSSFNELNNFSPLDFWIFQLKLLFLYWLIYTIMNKNTSIKSCKLSWNSQKVFA